MAAAGAGWVELMTSSGVSADQAAAAQQHYPSYKMADWNDQSPSSPDNSGRASPARRPARRVSSPARLSPAQAIASSPESPDPVQQRALSRGQIESVLNAIGEALDRSPHMQPARAELSEAQEALHQILEGVVIVFSEAQEAINEAQECVDEAEEAIKMAEMQILNKFKK